MKHVLRIFKNLNFVTFYAFKFSLFYPKLKIALLYAISTLTGKNDALKEVYLNSNDIL